jgi:hypothetical protein
MMQVPSLDFASLDFTGPVPEGTAGFCFKEPSQSVQRVAAAVGAQGEILSIPAPVSNSSWTVDFWAPSLNCQDVQGDESSAIWSNILDNWGNVSDCQQSYGYLAWAPSNESSLPFIADTNNNSAMILQSGLLNYGITATTYIATIPQMLNFAFIPSDAATQEQCRFFGSNSLIYTYPISDSQCLPGIPTPECYGQQAWTANATLLRCDLMNASYTADFDYTSNSQAIRIAKRSNEGQSAVTPHECVSMPKSNDTTVRTSNGLRCESTTGSCQFDQASMKLFSYQSIAYAFNKLILGSITLGGYNTPFSTPAGENGQQPLAGSTRTPGITFDTSIGNTVLMQTEELAFVVDFNGVNKSFNYLQLEVNQGRNPNYQGLTSPPQSGRRGDLKSALEKLFDNITISLLSEELLLPNYTSPYAPARLTEVSVHRYRNVYIYSEATLWTAYGIAMLLTIVAIGLGVQSIVLNHGSFANSFSTIVRVSRTAPMSAEILASESRGKHPLPKRLANTRIVIGSSVRVHELSTLPEVSETSYGNKDSNSQTFLLSRSRSYSRPG